MSKYLFIGSSRASNALRAEGFTTKQQVKKAILSGKLHWNYDKYSRDKNVVVPLNYGRISHELVCKELGIPLPGIVTSPQHLEKCIKYLTDRGYKVTPPKGESK